MQLSCAVAFSGLWAGQRSKGEESPSLKEIVKKAKVPSKEDRNIYCVALWAARITEARRTGLVNRSHSDVPLFTSRSPHRLSSRWSGTEYMAVMVSMREGFFTRLMQFQEDPTLCRKCTQDVVGN